jgi:hypothetical protein
MTETQEMVSDFLCLVREIHGSSSGIAPLGFNANSWTDRLKDDLREKMLDEDEEIVPAIAWLEHCLLYMSSRAPFFACSPTQQMLHFLRIAKCLCSVHHVLLHRYYYTHLRQEQAKFLLELCVVGSTVSYGLKVAGGQSCWSKAFVDVNKVVAVVDEVQSLGLLEVAGASAPFSSCIAAGDAQQDTSHLSGDLAVLPGRPLRTSVAPLRKRQVVAWAKRNGKVQVLSNKETMRFGLPLLMHLRTLFPFMQDVTTAAPQYTDFLPVFFTFADDLAQTTPKGEISREAAIFTSLLVVLALECVVAVQTPGRSILVICYLACVVEDVETFLTTALNPICEKWHDALNLNAATRSRYSFDQLRKRRILAVVGPLKCKGMTADVVFLQCMKRQRKDTKYAGLATDSTLLGIHYTRGKRRLYPFVHDLIAGTRLPQEGRERNRGFDLGVPRSSVAEDVSQSEVRRQLFYWNLKKLAPDIWRKSYSQAHQVVEANMQT